MITTTSIDLFGQLIKAVAWKFSLSTTNEQEAGQFIAEWTTAEKILKNYTKIITEVNDNINFIEGEQNKWIGYQNIICARLLAPADQLRRLCISYFREITEDFLDSESLTRTLSPLEEVAIDVDTTMQRLISFTILSLRRATHPNATSPNAQVNWCQERGVDYNDYILIPIEQLKTVNNKKIDPKAATKYSTISEIIGADNWEYCFSALLKYDPAVCDNSCRWIGKKGSKGILAGWVDQLEKKGYISIADRKHLIPLLENQFSGLKISRRILYETPKAYQQINDHFLKNIPTYKSKANP